MVVAQFLFLAFPPPGTKPSVAETTALVSILPFLLLEAELPTTLSFSKAHGHPIADYIF